MPLLRYLGTALRSTLALAVVFLPALSAAPARAGLLIDSLVIGVDVRVYTSIVSQSVPVLGTGIQLVESLTDPGNYALAMQTSGGFFQSHASATDDKRASSGASTQFVLDVRTDAPDTPLVLDFNFLGSRMGGTAFYGLGNMRILSQQEISYSFNGAADTTAWGFLNQIEQVDDPDRGGQNWLLTRDYSDPFGIGLPTEVIDERNYIEEFKEGLYLQLLPFHGTIDFGVLQPGETFRLTYFSGVSVNGNYTYDFPGTEAVSDLVDPFSLGGSPPSQVDLLGVFLPTASAPEPGALSLIALSALTAGGIAARRLRKAA